MNTITLQEFMKKTGAGKKTAEGWLDAGRIPGAEQVDGVWKIPASARRPYFPRCKGGASAVTLRTSMVRACQLQRHISPATYSHVISEGEFFALIGQLTDAGLITPRTEDGILYYDSTLQSEEYLHRSYEELKKFVGTVVQKLGEGLAYGGGKLLMEKLGSPAQG